MWEGYALVASGKGTQIDKREHRDILGKGAQIDIREHCDILGRVLLGFDVRVVCML